MGRNDLGDPDTYLVEMDTGRVCQDANWIQWFRIAGSGKVGGQEWPSALSRKEAFPGAQIAVTERRKTNERTRERKRIN
jgi:hypothetical protein